MIHKSARFAAAVHDPMSNEVIGAIALDRDNSSASPCQSIHCLLLNAKEKYRKWQLTCLGLVATDETLQEFKRIGLIFLYKTDWYGELCEYAPSTVMGQVYSDPHSARYIRTVCII
jgi:hypothetical protein